ncbi:MULTISPECIES: ABC transporter permease [Nostoc]|uniref:ABC transporter permease n=1 Tax=Nostoc paludosum FACHB-159 TaxID=2692908 RepID=A0ABR8K273_9NOSO|nr:MULTISPECIES: ABC transporter permease [Nostoc]MBD2683131.1 ABC transporter permease [Nostoc sp. FACHB-857]MBD2732841.1 ABC transporter permease [Nostoc paludosum FACHB-159]
MNIQTITFIISDSIRAATPLIFAALGELIAEKSGVLNLGVEGMMLVGAVAGFIAASVTGNIYFGLSIALISGIAIALIHALLTVTIAANQVATGLALSIFGSGLSAFIGAGYVGKTITGLQPVDIPILKSIPFLGKVLFHQDILVYASLVLAILVWWFLRSTRAGLVLRSIGESPDAADALGLPVSRVRYLAVMFGGAMAGLAGGYLSLAYTPLWAENMTGGRGWIAIALVVFATWKPERILLGAYLFGGVGAIQLIFQGLGVNISPYILSSLPYLATILVLVFISRDNTRIKLETPASLGQPFRSSH